MKKKWILLAEGLLLAVLFVLSFGGSDIVFEADHQQLYRVEETGGIVSKDFALNPGVYRIIVESDIANGGIGSGMEIHSPLASFFIPKPKVSQRVQFPVMLAHF